MLLNDDFILLYYQLNYMILNNITTATTKRLTNTYLTSVYIRDALNSTNYTPTY